MIFFIIGEYYIETKTAHFHWFIILPVVFKVQHKYIFIINILLIHNTSYQPFLLLSEYPYNICYISHFITMNSYGCPHCSKTFQSNKNLPRHIASCLRKRSPSCPHCHLLSPPIGHTETCRLEYQSRSNNKRPIKCSECFYHSKNNNDVLYHYARKHGQGVGTEKFQCDICTEMFNSFYSLRSHKITTHGTTQRYTNVEVDLSDFTSDTEAQLALTDYKHFLVDSQRTTKFQKIVNFPCTEYKTDLIIRKVDTMLQDLIWACKVNISFGYLLFNFETGAYRYFYAENNNPLFEIPLLIQNHEDKSNLKRLIEGANFIEHAMALRPDTKHRFFKLTNVTISATFVRNVPMGSSEHAIPDYIARNPHIWTLTHTISRNQIKDNKCLFRAIAAHRLGPRTDLELLTNELWNKYITDHNKTRVGFTGVSQINYQMWRIR